MEFNVHRPALQDKRVRQALIYGLDRQKLIDVVYQGYGKVAIEPIAPISWAFNAEGVNPYHYDPAQAKKLLDEAGWKAGATPPISGRTRTSTPATSACRC